MSSVDIIGTILISVQSTVPNFAFPSHVTEIKSGTSGNYAFLPVKNTIKSVEFSSDASLEIIGSYSFYYCGLLESINFRNCSKLKSIMANAFEYCSLLSSIEFPENGVFSSIDEYAFSRTAVKTIELPSCFRQFVSYYQFGYCDSLENVTFAPNSVIQDLGIMTFGYSALKNVVIPKSVTNLKQSPFAGTKITKFEVEKDHPVFATYDGDIYLSDFSQIIEVAPGKNSITFHKSCTKTRRYAFTQCNLVEIDIPTQIYDFDSYTFYFTRQTNKITIRNATIIPTHCFRYSTAKEIILPSNVITIQPSAFAMCNSLIKVLIPKGVTDLSGAFSEMPKTVKVEIEEGSPFTMIDGSLLCDNTTVHVVLYRGLNDTVYIPPTIRYIDGSAFAGSTMSNVVFEGQSVASFGTRAFSECPNLLSFTIPSTVTKILNYCFYKSAIKELVFPDTVTSVSNYVMAESSIEKFTFGKGFSIIYDHFFEKCYNLHTVIISSTITNINENAFKDCKSLTNVIFEGGTSLSIKETAFINTGFVSLTLPSHLSSMESFCFSNCANLETVDLSQTKLTSVPAGTFSGCSKLASVKYAQSINLIDERAFASCAFTKIGIPSHIVSILPNAFLSNHKLVTVSFDTSPKISTIGSTSFKNCSSLKQFVFSDDTSNFGEIDGILVDKVTHKLCVYPPAKEGSKFNVPESITTIGAFCFLDSLLKEVHFGPNLATIENEAFSGCDNLKLLVFEGDSLAANELSFVGVTLGCGSVIAPDSVLEVLLNCGFSPEALIPCPTEEIELYAIQHTVLFCSVLTDE